MYRSLVRGAPLALATALFATACIETPNGSTFTGSNVGRSLNLTGWVFSNTDTITIQVLADANADPDASGATWVDLTTISPSSNPINWGGDTLYYWNTNVTPVPSAALAARWPAGGLVRLRARNADGYALQTFDDDGCYFEGIGDGHNAGQIYSDCKSHDTPVLTFVDADPVPASTALYLSRRASPAAEAAQYNSQIAAPANLTAWKSTRGFPSGEVVARYYNKGDLGIGREMHCRQGNLGLPGIFPDVACYVTNYGSVTDGLADSTTALNDAINGHAPFATVAMDFFASAGSNKVRFYTYNGSGNLVTEAALDSEGDKPTPGICLSCHGGTYSSGSNSISGAHFLPFDLEAFGFASSGPWSKSAQQEAFRKMNAMIMATGPTASITTLVNGWYAAGGGVNAVGAQQDPLFLPTGWAGKEVVYHNAVAKYCRTCHVAVGPPIDTFSQLQGLGVKNAVCDGKYMPHSEVTRKSFWASSGRAHLVGALNIADACN
jgi:hypothetical protein